ncbi:MAG: glycosyltransferase [Flavobacterium circumlabens]|uniref:glycosyltransferase n=1 Tax=Flavobacterium circumlabens TaxID=2133765 RepID=UPI0032674105
MISIIVCSRKNQIDPKFEDNIRNTIGSDFELVIIDNSNNRYSIFEAYNAGIQKSKGDILCFIHDDILFHTENWGMILESEFNKNTDYALIGIAGSRVKTQFPTGWWDCEDQYKAINIIQHEKGNVRRECFGFENENITEAVVIDGVFMALKKDLNIVFDTRLEGFHCYDLNLSCAVIEKNKKVGVTKKILIEHFSIGKLNKNWLLSAIVFHKKYRQQLKRNNSNSEQEIFAGKKYIEYCLQFLGKKKSLIYLFTILQFSSSIKTIFTLEKYFFNKFFNK